ncbi:MAG: MBL fold metallo-hydrolase, partial [Thermoplasmata archaeon]|nr:MBL fold metallo-hydrolase [Thermoplasmata archaeon]
MAVKKILDGIYSVGAIDWHRRLFDELIPLPHGTSYNAYLIKDEKIVLIDTVDPSKSKELLANLDELGVDRIDYIIAQHAEQDHSGSLPAVIQKYPTAKIVTNSKCKNMLLDLLPLNEEDFIEVKDGEELSIGSRTLKFIFAPWVHWPETMLTYLKEDGILFTCDLFGSHMATSKMYVSNDALILQEAKRYYAEIMMPFASNIKKHL